MPKSHRRSCSDKKLLTVSIIVIDLTFITLGLAMPPSIFLATFRPFYDHAHHGYHKSHSAPVVIHVVLGQKTNENTKMSTAKRITSCERISRFAKS